MTVHSIRERLEQTYGRKLEPEKAGVVRRGAIKCTVTVIAKCTVTVIALSP